MKNTAIIGIIAGVGVVAGSILLAKQAKASPEESGLIPSADDILSAESIGELEIWYMYIGQIYFTGQIDREMYECLYQSYVTRFYQLVGDNQ